MPLVQTRGAASAQGFGEFAQATAANYIEDVFSCFLYTGTSANQTITNNIDLSTNGGLVWIKNRANTGGTYTASHNLYDTVRGMTFTAAQRLITDTTDAQVSQSNFIRADTTGFSFGTNATGAMVNASSNTYASWTFRKQPKFFDIVTYTGTGANRTIAHSLGSVPGCIIVKRTDTTADWAVYHRSLANTQYLVLNTTAAAATGATWWNSTTPTSAVFSLGTDASVNASGGTYVAYIYAHDAGGFGLAGTDNVISCGSFTETGTTYPTATVSLGWEPQFILAKPTNTVGDWFVVDTMRKLPAPTGNCTYLLPNEANAEATAVFFNVNATGFTVHPVFGNGTTYIYIAIRRGPMKVPTLGTSVFNTNLETTTTNPQTLTTGFPVDLSINTLRAGAHRYVIDRLRGTSTSSYQEITTNRTNAETTGTGGGLGFDNNTGIVDSTYWNNIQAIFWNFRRAPSFFDEVCYTGTGSNPNVQTHNLGVAPELIIFKRRASVAANWLVATQFTASTFLFLYLDLDISNTASSYPSGVLNAQPTSTSFSIASTGNVLNASGGTYVAYLFATCAGVSKVGSYTGNGSSQTINCGFGAGGARFVLIKRTDSTGDWYTYDTARGMTTLTDPYLWLNSTAAEVATLGSVTTVSTGFALNSAILAAINVSAGTYIFLAIA